LINDAQTTRGEAKALRAQADVRLADISADERERFDSDSRAVLADVDTRLRQLADAEARHSALEKAEREHRDTEVASVELRKRIGEIDEPDRLPVATAEAGRTRAQADVTAHERALDESKTNANRLVQQRSERGRLGEQATAVRRAAHLNTRLGELLGRTRLQAYLVDDALSRIEILANESLRRTSQLELDLERQPTGGGEEEIVIQVTDLASADDPLDVEFISGGQKFRVAVAIAAAIGQHAGGLMGAPRALIVDEGFGSLDDAGRQEMIKELQSLAQYLDRVIVVSHHSDFRDRTLFPSGYLIRKDGQLAAVERFV
jgi:DNA repair exonuclease SbcCD ATPase subunit